jgi:hypothetical protein
VTQSIPRYSHHWQYFGPALYNNDTLSVTPAGAAIQFWGNASALTGQALIDTGAAVGASINLRTATAGQGVNTRLRVDEFGNVTITGNLGVGGTKAFVIDHPQDPANYYLYHSAVEAPEQLNMYSGTVVTNLDGDAVVSLPGYFGALNRDIRYQLTVLRQFAQAIVASKINNGQFMIKTDQDGSTERRGLLAGDRRPQRCLCARTSVRASAAQDCRAAWPLPAS